MTKADWDDGGARLLGMFLNGEEIVTPGVHGERIVDESYVLLFNASHEDAEFTLPPERFGTQWTCELRTDEEDCGGTYGPSDTLGLVSRSLVLLRRTQV
jgi:glycogen operon protein